MQSSPRTPNRTLADSPWVALLLFVVLALASARGSIALSRAEDRLIAGQAAAVAAGAVSALDASITAHGRALNRLASAWRGAASVDGEDWLRTANVGRSVIGSTWVGYLPAGGSVRYEAAEGDATASRPSGAVGATLEARRRRAELSGASWWVVVPRGPDVWFGASLPTEDAPTGQVAASVPADRVFGGARARGVLDGYVVTVWTGATFVALGTVGADVDVSSWEVSEELRVGGDSWVVSAVPTAARLAAARTGTPRLVLVFGLLLSALAAGAVRLAQLARGASRLLRAREVEVRALNADLELRVQERTEELARTNRDLEQFAYAASHDLQEPLRMVVSYLQLIESEYAERLDDTGRLYLDYAVDGGLRMRALIRALLHYSRLGRRGLAPSPVALDEVLASTLADLEVAVAERAARITVEPLPIVHGDRDLLVHLFQNLVSNALKYSTEQPVVRVAGRVVEGFAVVRVEDQGIGVADEDAERVFELFTRLHGREAFPGTGLGLAVCKRVVELHHGTIAIERGRLRGTCVEVRLPSWTAAVPGAATGVGPSDGQPR